MTLDRRLVCASALLGGVCVLTLLAAGPGYRVELWGLHPAFTLMRWSAYGAIAAVVFAVLGLIIGRRNRSVISLGITGLVLGTVTVLIPLRQMQVAESVPPIHDITTDTNHPPEFVAILALRKDAPNSAQYGGAAVAEQQLRAFPEIQPVTLAASISDTFDRATRAARLMHWEIAAGDRAAGRIEATATTRWFGFKDDVIIRITAVDTNRSRVDVRSVSRVGGSDLGANARRIREFLSIIQKD